MKKLMRNTLLILMLAAMLVPNMGALATEVDDTYVNDEDNQNVEDVQVEPAGEVAEEEPQISEEEFQEQVNNAEENQVITGMDENGDIYETELGDGWVEQGGQAQRSATAAKIVNFYTKGSSTTSYTEYLTGKSGYTCGAYAADAAYLGTSNGKVKFMLGGVIGQVNSSEVQVVNKSAARSVSHYKVSSGKLYHYISTNLNNSSYGSTLLVGAAPSYLSSGVTYYSYDGHYFYTEANFGNMLANYNNGTRNHSVNASSPYYNYFQYLPLRSGSSYSGSVLSTYINNKGGSNSKMYNTGTNFVNMQGAYGTNALLMIGIGANESNWGKSNISQTKNNLFGLNAVDSSPGASANYYSSVATCIKDFSETYLSKRYLRPGYTYYRGAFLGDKASGMNIMYASDPYWGEKAASIAWNLDYSNGSRDAKKYTIGIKDNMSHKHTNLNVRKEASTASTVLYQTGSQSHHSFLILNNTASNGFYKVQSDGVLNSGRTAINTGSGQYNFNNMYAYASADYITIVSPGGGAGSGGGNPASVSYSTHIQGIGWQGLKYNGESSGTTGRSLRVEALKVNVQNVSNLGVKYSAHVQDIGWQGYAANGAISGTTNQSKRLEAIKIELTGSAASSYDIYYRVHCQDYGWLGWAKNGAAAGTKGHSKRMEAIEIRLVSKNAGAPGGTANAYIEKLNSVSYSSHIQDIGWQASLVDGALSGTTGQSKRLEAIKVTLPLKQYSGGIQYRSHIQDIGWQGFVSNGALSGTTGKSKRLEAVQIKLTGEMAAKFDIYYRAHVQDFGWMGWAKNGASAGSQGYSYRMEAIQVQLVAKGKSAPAGGGVAFKQR